jgi:hypothetical protein
LDGHDPKNKIGIITEANIEMAGVAIAGFFYQKNFEEELALIREEKDLLGFSIEADFSVRDVNEEIWTVSNIVFTGAAILYKADAAYTKTSLAASRSLVAEKENAEMEELKKLMEAILKRVEALEGIEKKEHGAEANKDLIAKIKPHADACRACAEGMRAEGIGLHAKRGHVAILHKIAASMESEAAMGRIPSELPSNVFHDSDYMYAEREREAGREFAKAMEGIKGEIASMGTKMADLQAAAIRGAEGPARKTLTPEITALLTRTNLLAEAEKGELKVEDVDRTLEAAGIKGRTAIEAKLKMMAEGLLPARK